VEEDTDAGTLSASSTLEGKVGKENWTSEEIQRTARKGGKRRFGSWGLKPIKGGGMGKTKKIDNRETG